MKAWITHAVDDMRLETVPDPKPRPGWAVVRVLVVQPSITEIQLFRGDVSSGHDVVKRRLEDGPASLFGHEFSAEVVALDAADADNEHGLREGDRVTAGHSAIGTIGRHFPGCFAEYAAVPLDALVPVADELSDWEAAALQPLSTCVRQVGRLGVDFESQVVVFGQGVMGLLSTQVARARGAASVIGVDARADALTAASQLGADVTIDVTADDVVATVLEHTDGVGAHLAVEAAGGSPAVGLAGAATVDQAVHSVRPGGTILGLAHYHAPVVMDFNLCRAKGIVYRFPNGRATRGDLQRSALLVGKGNIELGLMLTHRLDGIEQVPQAMEITAAKREHSALNPAQVRVGSRQASSTDS